MKEIQPVLLAGVAFIFLYFIVWMKKRLLDIIILVLMIAGAVLFILWPDLTTVIAKKVGVSGVDVNVSVNNPYTFSNIRQVLNYDNTWMASFPTARSYMFGLNVNF